jgi:hypothetical protein
VFFTRASQLIDLWLAAVRGLRWAWRTFPGDVLGWMVMRGSGVTRPTRIVEVGDVTAHVVEDERLGRYLDTAFSPIHAQAVGRYVFCRGHVDDRILAHEAEHIRQWRRYGPFYLPVYFGSALWRRAHGGRDNFLEDAAISRAERDSRRPG